MKILLAADFGKGKAFGETGTEMVSGMEGWIAPGMPPEEVVWGYRGPIKIRDRDNIACQLP
jgi:hypothetical protein